MSHGDELVEQVLDTIYCFVKLHETDAWLKNISNADIIKSFKCSLFVEKAIEKCKSEHSEQTLMRSLQLKCQGNFKIYEIHFFEKAADHILKKMINSTVINEVSADVALRVYSSMFSQTRLENILFDCLLKSVSYNSIMNYIVQENNNINVDNLEIKLLYNSWHQQVIVGNSASVENIVKIMLNSYQIDRELKILFSILLVDDLNKDIKDIIKQELDFVLRDRSILSKKYWVVLIKSLDVHLLLKVCASHQDLLKSILNIIVYLLCMLICEDNRWVMSTNIECSEICYFDLIRRLKSLHDHAFTQKIVKCTIDEAQRNIGTPIWCQIQAVVDL
ncbi:PREDICTED: uncharacterized protein LOC108556325 [Nicrophorus vespilloides]|uniref:Uncharacterized protein LOC108556325 n=1 Tax=Nicrophorus vespilloides TaxID=110193 RepID=A0ABM1LZY0_NICVS|nr:PREDICTED: uncharacterized protein LOC108556325 [Nicrophorus vespilloides]